MASAAGSDESTNSHDSSTRSHHSSAVVAPLKLKKSPNIPRFDGKQQAKIILGFSGIGKTHLARSANRQFSWLRVIDYSFVDHAAIAPVEEVDYKRSYLATIIDALAQPGVLLLDGRNWVGDFLVSNNLAFSSVYPAADALDEYGRRWDEMGHDRTYVAQMITWWDTMLASMQWPYGRCRHYELNRDAFLQDIFVSVLTAADDIKSGIIRDAMSQTNEDVREREREERERRERKREERARGERELEEIERQERRRERESWQREREEEREQREREGQEMERQQREEQERKQQEREQQERERQEREREEAQNRTNLSRAGSWLVNALGRLIDSHPYLWHSLNYILFIFQFIFLLSLAILIFLVYRRYKIWAAENEQSHFVTAGDPVHVHRAMPKRHVYMFDCALIPNFLRTFLPCEWYREQGPGKMAAQELINMVQRWLDAEKRSEV